MIDVPEGFNLERISSDIERAFDTWKRGLKDTDDLFHAQRYVTGMSTYRRIEEMNVPDLEKPLRDACGRWVLWLLQKRVTAKLTSDLRRAKDDAFAIVRFESSRKLAWDALWGGLLGETDEARASVWATALASAAESLSNVSHRLRELECEVATRAGLPGPEAPLLPVSPATLDVVATGFLQRTNDLALSLVRERARVPKSERIDWVQCVQAANARDVVSGWPAKPTLRWAGETGWAHSAAGERRPVLGVVCGAATFMRALGNAYVLRRADLARTSQPFTLAFDPAAVLDATFFSLGAMTCLEPSFHKHALGLATQGAQEQARRLALTMLLEVRLRALEWLLRDRDADSFEGLTEATFGSALAESFFGVWPAIHDATRGRLVGSLHALMMWPDLRSRFDEDWFRNPMCYKSLDAQAAGGALMWDSTLALDSALALDSTGRETTAAHLAAWFEGRCT